MDINGIIYLLNQAGLAIAQSEAEISTLQKRVAELESGKDNGINN